MAIEQESGETKEPIQGKIYGKAYHLGRDLETHNTVYMRFWGAQLQEQPSKTTAGETYLEIVPTPEQPENNFLGVAQAIHYTDRPETARINVNAYDYTKPNPEWPRRGTRFKETYLRITDQNVRDYRIEVLSPDIAQRLIEKIIKGESGK